MIWVYYYLVNGIILDLHFDNFCWIGKIPNIATNNINIWFFTQQTVSPAEIELVKLDCINNYLPKIQGSFHNFLTAFLLGYNKFNLSPVS